jgi:TPR repeat protein
MFDEKSVAAFKQQAASGDAAAQCGLGMMYRDGSGVPQDYTQAAFWWRKAAEQGGPWAQYQLGALYAAGRGVPRDYAQAAFWYRKAAEQGDADAQDALGDLHHDGHGVPQDNTQAGSADHRFCGPRLFGPVMERSNSCARIGGYSHAADD